LGQDAALQTGPSHCPVVVLQVLPERQAPQVPALPQPSGPHCLPAQFGAQQSPAGLHWLAGSEQQPSNAQHPVVPSGQVAPPHWFGGFVQTWPKQLPLQQSLFF
jgi:hypothetical protein